MSQYVVHWLGEHNHAAALSLEFQLDVLLPLAAAQLGFNFLYISKSVPLGVYVVKLVSFAVQSAFRYTVFLSPNFPSVSI